MNRLLLITVATILIIFISSIVYFTTFTSNDVLIDPRILQISDDFKINTNIGIESILVNDAKLAIIITTVSDNNGTMKLDNPLPLLKGLFSNNITSFTIISNEQEINYTIQNEILSFDITNSGTIMIIGFTEL